MNGDTGGSEPTAVEGRDTGQVVLLVVPVVGEVSEDMPVMEGVYDIQAGPRGNSVAYQVDATIEDVVLF